MLKPFLPVGATDLTSTLMDQVQTWSDMGLRVLLFAYNPDVTRLHNNTGEPELPPLTPLAVISLSDELRPQAKETLSSFEGLGIGLKIISGDNPQTVAALAKQAGLTHTFRLVSGPELAVMSEAEFRQVANEATVFGRITPEQKEALVETLIKHGHYVAMMGDGVNDVLSLKKANLGIAMQSGSQATRNVADMVLLNDSFAALQPAFGEGQRIVGGLTNAMYLFIARVVISALVIIAITMIGLDFPFEPAQVALTLFTVGIPTFFLTLWARPTTLKEGVLTSLMQFVIPAAILSMLIGILLYTVTNFAVLRRFSRFDIPSRAVERFESYTGLTYNVDDEFGQAAATIVAQTMLSTFISYTAFILILFLEPPHHLFTGWATRSPDQRPLWLVAALWLIFTIVVSIERFSTYFGLVRVPPSMLLYIWGLVLIWAFILRSMWRSHWLNRVLGLEVVTSIPSAIGRK